MSVISIAEPINSGLMQIMHCIHIYCVTYIGAQHCSLVAVSCVCSQWWTVVWWRCCVWMWICEVSVLALM